MASDATILEQPQWLKVVVDPKKLMESPFRKRVQNWSTRPESIFVTTLLRRLPQALKVSLHSVGDSDVLTGSVINCKEISL